jgi:hypothetical protein
MNYDKIAPFMKAQDTFEYHCLNHLFLSGNMSQEEYDREVKELYVKYTKLSKLLAGKEE